MQERGVRVELEFDQICNPTAAPILHFPEILSASDTALAMAKKKAPASKAKAKAEKKARAEKKVEKKEKKKAGKSKPVDEDDNQDLEGILDQVSPPFVDA